jgi:hypothetical protein
LGKDFGRFVLKAEAVYSSGRSFEVTTLTRPNGVVTQKTVDAILGLEFMLPAQGRLNLQAFQRAFLDYDEDILLDQFETGVTLLVSVKVTPKIEPELLVIQSLNGNDRMIRPRVNLALRPDLTARFGVDLFSGPSHGLFGRFSNRDRAYAELRYAF